VTGQQLEGHLRDLRSPRSEARHAAADALVSAGEDAVPSLVEALAVGGHSGAVDALARIGKRALPGLRSGLRHEDAFVRARSAHTLGRIGDMAAVPDLLHAAQDADERVRWNAVDALVKMNAGDSRFRRALRVGDIVTAAAVYAMSESSPTDAIPVLIEGLKHRYSAEAASRGLLDIASQSPVPELRQALPALRNCLRRRLWVRVDERFLAQIRWTIEAIETATERTGSLPVPSTSAERVAGLPRPALAPELDANTVPIPSSVTAAGGDA
jgi:HEAT repeat protein